jgi:hypothetical protein
MIVRVTNRKVDAPDADEKLGIRSVALMAHKHIPAAAQDSIFAEISSLIVLNRVTFDFQAKPASMRGVKKAGDSVHEGDIITGIDN